MYDFDQELFELITPDKNTTTLDIKKIIEATRKIQKEVSNRVNSFRQGRKVFEVTEISKEQMHTYKHDYSVALYRLKGGEFEKTGTEKHNVPIKPILISRIQTFPYENIEDQIPICGWFDFMGKTFAQIEDRIIVETLMEASNKNIEAETKGVLAFKDIGNAKGKIDYPQKSVLVANPRDVRDLAKKFARPFDEVLGSYQLKIMETNQINKGEAILCDGDKYSISIFERKPISVKIFDNPANGGVGIRITQRVIPIVLDCEKVVTIANC